MKENPKAKIDNIFAQQCAFNDRSEAAQLDEAIRQYCQHTNQPRPQELTPEFVQSAKKHFLNTQQTFLMNIQQPSFPVGDPEII